MAEKKIQPKRPSKDEPAAGARKATKTSARRTLNRKLDDVGLPSESESPATRTSEARAEGPGFVVPRSVTCVTSAA